jgi:class 3 adenylate cyclase
MSRLRAVTRAGVDDDTPPTVAKYIVSCNLMAAFSGPFTLAFTPVEIYLRLWPNLIAGVIFAPVCWSALWLNAQRRYDAARAVVVVSCLAVICAEALLAGKEGGLQFFLFAVPPIVHLMLPPWEERAALGISFTAPILFLGLYQLFPLVPPPHELLGRAAPWLFAVNLAGVFAFIIAGAHYGRVGILHAETQLVHEQRKSDMLLLNILPAAIARRLKASPAAIADGFPAVSVLFADIVGFTTLSTGMSPHSVVTFLNEIFTRFDELTSRHRLEKIKTIGDCYMVASGLPAHREDHAIVLAEMALDMRETVRAYSQESGLPLQMRIGINTGPVVAGVIGKTKYIYDLWGDTVNTASRMESHGLPGTIQITDSTRALIEGRYRIDKRGEIDVKGKGVMTTYWLVGRLTPPNP